MIMERKLISPSREELQKVFANKFKLTQKQIERKKEFISALKDFGVLLITFLAAVAVVCANQIIEFIQNL